MSNGNLQANQTWSKFSAFRVLGDHEPMPGFRLVMQFAPDNGSIMRVLSSRARATDPVDSDLARVTIRAGIGLLQSRNVSFVYANSEEVVALIRGDAVSRMGSSMAVYEQLISMFSARMALLLGEEIIIHGKIYEFPDLGIARRAFISGLEWLEDGASMRAAQRLGAQLRGLGKPFDPQTIISIEGQSNLLRSAGVDLESLPGWWWRGIAARFRGDGGVELYDDVPAGAEFAALITDV